MTENYTPEEQAALLRVARSTLEAATAGYTLSHPDLESLPESLREPRACFVTLHTLDGELRGCTGTLTARQPLVQEVSHVAVQTAFNDPRFPPLRADELPEIQIEISVLTPPVELAYTMPEDLLRLLRPHVDGVILAIGARRATFLPQVWDHAPQPDDFLDLLCHKMGMPSQSWKLQGTKVYTYQAIIIQEQPAAA